MACIFGIDPPSPTRFAANARALCGAALVVAPSQITPFAPYLNYF
jgi:hypothetical protein